MREGLIAVVSVKVPEPQFEGQTKTKLGNSEVEGFVSSAVNEKLGEYLEENPEGRQGDLREGHARRRGPRGGPQGARADAPQEQPRGTACPASSPTAAARSNEDTELFLVEGDSAGGSRQAGARLRTSRRSLPLRGKIINVEKANLVKMLGHEEIRTIISALGTGIGDDFNIAKRRYGKIIIMTDADVDGSHIRTLLLTFFFRHMQELIKAGRVYVAQPPLYQVTRKKKVEYVLNERAMRQIYTELGLEGTQLVIRDADTGKEARALDGEELRRVVELLASWKSWSGSCSAAGSTSPTSSPSATAPGELPLYRVVVDGEEQFFHAADERDDVPARAEARRRRRGRSRPTATASAATATATAPSRSSALQKNHELHEVKDLEKLFSQLEQYGLSIDDYFLTQEESVSGEKLRDASTRWSRKTRPTTSPASRSSCRRSTRSASRASRSSASRAWAR